MSGSEKLQTFYQNQVKRELEHLKYLDAKAKAKVEKEREKERPLTAQREAKKLAEANSRRKINTVHTVLDFADIFKKGE